MNTEHLLGMLRFAGAAVLLVSAWSVWERRLTFQSRFDVAGTVAVALFGAGAALDSPWPGLAEASFPVTGRYYGLMVVGQLCYLAGAATVIRAAYRRLMPDDGIGPFMRWINGAAVAAGIVMVVAFCASSVPRTMSVEHLYLAVPDGWLTLYWVTHFGTETIFGLVAGYGVLRLRGDPRSVLLNLTLGSLMLASLSGGVIVGWGVITDRILTVRLAAWFLTYLAFMAAAVATAAQWRHRMRALLQPSRA